MKIMERFRLYRKDPDSNMWYRPVKAFIGKDYNHIRDAVRRDINSHYNSPSLLVTSHIVEPIDESSFKDITESSRDSPIKYSVNEVGSMQDSLDDFKDCLPEQQNQPSDHETKECLPIPLMDSLVDNVIDPRINSLNESLSFVDKYVLLVAVKSQSYPSKPDILLSTSQIDQFVKSITDYFNGRKICFNIEALEARKQHVTELHEEYCKVLRWRARPPNEFGGSMWKKLHLKWIDQQIASLEH